MIEVRRHNPGWEVLSFLMHLAIFAALVLCTPVRKLILPERPQEPPAVEQMPADKLEKLDEKLAEARSRELQRDLTTLQTVLNDMEVVRDQLRQDFDDVVKDLADDAKEELKKAAEEAKERQKEALAEQDEAQKNVDRLAEAEKQDLAQSAQKVEEAAHDLYWQDFMDVAAAQANAQNALDRVQTAASFAGYEKVAEAAKELRDAQIAAARTQAAEAEKILEPTERIAAFQKAAKDKAEAEKKAEEERKAQAENQQKKEQAAAEEKQAAQKRDEAEKRRDEAEKQRSQAEDRRNDANREKADAENEKRQAENRKRDAENRARQAQNEENQAKNREQQAARDEQAAKDRGQKAENERKSAEERRDKAEQDQKQARERADKAEQEQRQAKEKAEQAGREEKSARDREAAARRENRTDDANAAKSEAEQKAREKSDAQKAEQAAKGAKEQAQREEKQAQDRRNQAERERSQAEQRKGQAEREENQARERKERAQGDAKQAAERRDEQNRNAAAENEKAQQADQRAKAAQEKSAVAERERSEAQKRAEQARSERDRADSERRTAENRSNDANSRARNAADRAQEHQRNAENAQKRMDEARKTAQALDANAQKARQARARDAQQKVLDAMAKLDAAIESDVARPKSHVPETLEASELATLDTSDLSISESYEMARSIEEAVTETYREVVAASTALEQRLPLEEAERLTDVAKPVREDFDADLLDGRARTAEQLAAQKEARYNAVRETENMVDASMAMMNEAFRLSGFGEGGEFRDRDRRVAMGLKWLRRGDLAGHDEGERAEKFHALAGLSMQIERAAAEDRHARAKDLRGVTMGGLMQQGAGNKDENYRRVAGRAGEYVGQPASRGEAGTGADLLPGNVLAVDETSRGMPGGWMYLESWWIIGPFPNPDRVNITRKFPPESVIDLDAAYEGAGGLVQWQFSQARTPFPSGKPNRHRSEVIPPNRREFAIWYGYTILRADRECDVWLAAGSDDRSDVWVNGMKVWASGNNRKVWTIDEGFRRIHLQKGANAVLVRLENGPGPTSFSVCVSPHDTPPPL